MPKKIKSESVPLERRDAFGPMRLMAVAEGYVMVKRKGNFLPLVQTIDDWNKLSPINGD